MQDKQDTLFCGGLKKVPKNAYQILIHRICPNIGNPHSLWKNVVSRKSIIDLLHKNGLHLKRSPECTHDCSCNTPWCPDTSWPLIRDKRLWKSSDRERKSWWPDHSPPSDLSLGWLTHLRWSIPKWFIRAEYSSTLWRRIGVWGRTLSWPRENLSTHYTAPSIRRNKRLHTISAWRSDIFGYFTVRMDWIYVKCFEGEEEKRALSWPKESLGKQKWPLSVGINASACWQNFLALNAGSIEIELFSL